jgi:hypothetical protein
MAKAKVCLDSYLPKANVKASGVKLDTTTYKAGFQLHHHSWVDVTDYYNVYTVLVDMPGNSKSLPVAFRTEKECFEFMKMIVPHLSDSYQESSNWSTAYNHTFRVRTRSHPHVELSISHTTEELKTIEKMHLPIPERVEAFSVPYAKMIDSLIIELLSHYRDGSRFN